MGISLYNGITTLGNDFHYVSTPKKVDAFLNKHLVKEKTMEITKDNIKEVLEFNGVDKSKYKIFRTSGIDVIHMINGEDFGYIIYYKNPLWLQLLEVYTGKLKPLPEFDFKQYLLDSNLFELAGEDYVVTTMRDIGLIIKDDKFTFESETACNYYSCDKPNADRLIKMAKIGKEME